MFPDLVDVGFLHLKTYGACMAAGFLLCWTLVERLSGRKDISNLLMSLMISGIVGSRAAYVVEHWSAEFAAHPADVLRVDQGGLIGVLGTGLPGLGTEHLPGALCSGTGSPALGLCSP